MSGKKCSCEWQMIGVLVAGAVLGGVIAFTLLSYLWEWGTFKGARWWDVMTAFGTMVSASGAVGIAYFANKSAKITRLNAALAYSISASYLIDEAATHIEKSLRPSAPILKGLTPFEHLEKAINALKEINLEIFSLGFPDESIYIAKAISSIRKELIVTDPVVRLIQQRSDPRNRKIVKELTEISSKVLIRRSAGS